MSLGGAVMRNVTRNSGEPKTIKMFFNIFWPIKEIFIAILTVTWLAKIILFLKYME